MNKKRNFIFLILFTATSLTAQYLPETATDQAQVTNVSELNTAEVEYTPYILPDETMIFFQSNRAGSVGFSGNYDIWMAVNRTPDSMLPVFQTPINIGLPVNSPGFEGMPTVRKYLNGDLDIIFTSIASSESGRNGTGETDLYFSRYRNERWSPSVPILEINSPFKERMPSLSADGKILFFSSNRPGGVGQDDIWMSFYNDSTQSWGTPINAGESVNTPASEISPSLHSDGITLYYSSNKKGGAGGYDIYFVQRKGMSRYSEFTPAQNLGLPYNSAYDDEYPTVSASGDIFYFSSNRKGGKGMYDIYRAELPYFARPRVVLTLRGYVRQENSDKGLEATIQISNDNYQSAISSSPPSGQYQTQLLNKNTYRILVSAPGFLPEEDIIDLRRHQMPAVISRNYSLRREISLAKNISIEVFFEDTTGEVIKPSAYYYITPTAWQEKILPFSGKRGQINLTSLPTEREALESFLRSNTVHVMATLPGHENAKFEGSLFEILESSAGSLERGEIHIVMRSNQVIANNGNTNVTQNSTVTQPDSQEINLQLNEGVGPHIATFYFPHNVSNKLSQPVKDDELNQLVQIIQQRKPLKIILHGNADASGTEARNEELSHDRAEYIRDLLIKKGFAKEMIRLEWHGSRRPAVSEKDEATRSLNRRVEVHLLMPAPKTESKDQAISAEKTEE